MIEKLSDDQIDLIVESTLKHYDTTAEDFWESSKGHNIEQNYNAFLSAMPSDKQLKILDMGCGPGRDLRYFKEQGHEVVGLEGSEIFCEMAKKYAECEVLQQNFLRLDLPSNEFDGVFANAVLFHVPPQELAQVLRNIWATLKDGGIFFSSNPRKPHVVWYQEHPGTYLEFDPFQAKLDVAGFQVIDHYYRPPGVPREEQFWIAVTSRKMGAKH